MKTSSRWASWDGVSPADSAPKCSRLVGRFAGARRPQPHLAPRETAILQGLDLVNSIADKLHRRVPPSVTFDDLAGAGTIGLIQAVDRFDQARGAKFKSYAQHRILGAMLDFLPRRRPALSISTPARTRLASALNRPATDSPPRP